MFITLFMTISSLFTSFCVVLICRMLDVNSSYLAGRRLQHGVILCVHSLTRLSHRHNLIGSNRLVSSGRLWCSSASTLSRFHLPFTSFNPNKRNTTTTLNIDHRIFRIPSILGVVAVARRADQHCRPLGRGLHSFSSSLPYPLELFPLFLRSISCSLFSL